MREYKDYFIGFAGVIMIAFLYAGSYAMWRTLYPVQRGERCDVNEWYIDLPDGAMATVYRPAIEVERELNCYDTVIRISKK